MESSIGAVSYGVAAGAYSLLFAIMATAWRGRFRGGLLLAAVGVMTLWAGINAWQLGERGLPAALIWTLEALHLVFWLEFLWQLLPAGIRVRRHLRWIRYAGFGLVSTLVIQAWTESWLERFQPAFKLIELPLTGQLLLALAGLILVEQLYRNTRPDRRWYIKFLCLALGGFFAYEFYLYSDALLFKRIDLNLWMARGLMASLLVPFLAVTAARNPDWSVAAFVSRDFVFHSVAVVGAGLYLLVMATAGYYVRSYGGQWGEVIRIAFLAAAFLLLLVLLFSGQVRAQLRVLLDKHFFNYRYDYRKEWLRITANLSYPEDASPLGERVIRTLADLVESPSGLLWVRSETGRYFQQAEWGDPGFQVASLESDDPVVDFLRRKEWVVNLRELKSLPELYPGFVSPPWLAGQHDAWLLIPLFYGETLWGMVLLTRPRARVDCNWEVLDVLKTAGRQAASFLVVEETAQRLLEARQFEGFNRLAAFVVHDLKNLIAQLSLVVRNADKHAANPEFVRDAMTTVEHAVGKMNSLLSQLRNLGAEKRKERIDLRSLLQEVVAARASQLPRPRYECLAHSEIYVLAQPDRLASAFEHIIQNAQEAAGKSGNVKVMLEYRQEQAIVEVEDNGQGMDAEFVQHRLFKPFETTKGLSGMGIGAYESREYVRALGGELTVQSVPGEGSRFRFALPLAECVSDKTQSPQGVSV